MKMRQVNRKTGEQYGEVTEGRLPTPFVEILDRGSWLPLEPEDFILGHWEITDISGEEKKTLKCVGFFDEVERAKAKHGYS